MKTIAFLGMLLTLSSCASKTSFGPCIGVVGKENPKYEYEVNVGNVILGIVFSETIVVPAIVVLGQFKCPVREAAP